MASIPWLMFGKMKGEALYLCKLTRSKNLPIYCVIFGMKSREHWTAACSSSLAGGGGGGGGEQISAAAVAAYFKKSKLRSSVLRQIWRISDESAPRGFLNRREWETALKLIAAGQAGYQVELASIEVAESAVGGALNPVFGPEAACTVANLTSALHLSVEVSSSSSSSFFFLQPCFLKISISFV